MIQKSTKQERIIETRQKLTHTHTRTNGREALKRCEWTAEKKKKSNPSHQTQAYFWRENRVCKNTHEQPASSAQVCATSYTRKIEHVLSTKQANHLLLLIVVVGSHGLTLYNVNRIVYTYSVHIRIPVEYIRKSIFAKKKFGMWMDIYLYYVCIYIDERSAFVAISNVH